MANQSQRDTNEDEDNSLVDFFRFGNITMFQFEIGNETSIPLPLLVPPPLFLQFFAHFMIHSLVEDRVDAEERKERLKEMVKHIPTISWSKSLPSAKQTQCAICLTEFEESESVKELPCYHHFHVHCIDPWVSSNPNCPLCKADVGNSVEELQKILSDREKLKQDKLKKEEQKKRREEQRKRRAAKSSGNSSSASSNSQPSTSISSLNVISNANSKEEYPSQPVNTNPSEVTISNSNSEPADEEVSLKPKQLKRKASSRADAEDRDRKRQSRSQDL